MLNMFIDFSTLMTDFYKWANVLSAASGLLSAIMLGFSEKLIPWGLRLPKHCRHPYKLKHTLNNMLNQSTTNREEWWGSHFKTFGLILLALSFAIQLLAGLP